MSIDTVAQLETEAFRRVREFVESSDKVLSDLADLFRDLAERGSMDELACFAKLIDMMLMETQSRIALRN